MTEIMMTLPVMILWVIEDNEYDDQLPIEECRWHDTMNLQMKNRVKMTLMVILEQHMPIEYFYTLHNFGYEKLAFL